MNNDIITLIANVALTLSFIVALVFGIAQVKTPARDRKERFTLDALRNFQTREFAELIQFINFRNPLSGSKELRSLSERDQVMFIQFGQEMESLGMLVAEGYVDLDLVDKTLGSFVTSSWEKYRKVFMDTRVNQPDPFLGEYFQWLAERIDERMRLNPRKPFHETQASLPRKRL